MLPDKVTQESAGIYVAFVPHGYVYFQVEHAQQADGQFYALVLIQFFGLGYFFSQRQAAFRVFFLHKVFVSHTGQEQNARRSQVFSLGKTFANRSKAKPYAE
jgi:hypothetical protein